MKRLWFAYWCLKFLILIPLTIIFILLGLILFLPTFVIKTLGDFLTYNYILLGIEVNKWS